MSNNISKDLQFDFEQYVSRVVGANYKTGILGKQRTRWGLVKAWNHRSSRIAAPGMIRKEIGDEAATKLFQDTCDKIISSPASLEMAIREAKVQDMFNQS